MRTTTIAACVAASALAFGAAVAGAQSGTTTVSGTSNIYLSNGNTMTAYGGGGQGIAPVQINLNSGTSRTATFTATGTWGCNNVNGFSVDGANCVSTNVNINSSGDISGVVMHGRSMPLVGVFTNGSLPASAPASLTFGTGGISFTDTSYPAPLLGQIFFIGDGLTGTGSGANQFFAVPDGATTLFLGVADAPSFQGNPGTYGDNVGSVSVQYAITAGSPVTTTPEPSSLALLASGIAGLVPIARRRAR